MILHLTQKKLNQSYIPIIKIQDNQIEWVNTFKFLGIILDSTLSWNPHVNMISNKLSRICAVISKLKKTLPTHILLKIYNALFYST